MTRIVVCHPKGGVGRSTTTYMLGVQLARQHPEWRIALEDRDQAGHLSRMYSLYPPGRFNLEMPAMEQFPLLEEASVTLVDTAPEASFTSLFRILDGCQWMLVPVKGPEAGSVQVLPSFLHWFDDQGSDCRLMGFLPTMWKPRRSEAQRWLAELHSLANERGCSVFEPIPDTAAIAAWRTDARPYASLARSVVTTYLSRSVQCPAAAPT